MRQGRELVSESEFDELVDKFMRYPVLLSFAWKLWKEKEASASREVQDVLWYLLMVVFARLYRRIEDDHFLKQAVLCMSMRSGDFAGDIIISCLQRLSPDGWNSSTLIDCLEVVHCSLVCRMQQIHPHPRESWENVVLTHIQTHSMTGNEIMRNVSWHELSSVLGAMQICSLQPTVSAAISTIKHNAYVSSLLLLLSSYFIAMDSAYVCACGR